MFTMSYKTQQKPSLIQQIERHNSFHHHFYLFLTKNSFKYKHLGILLPLELLLFK